MRCLNRKLQSPKLEQSRSYPTKRSITYHDALRPYIVWGAWLGRYIFQVRVQFSAIRSVNELCVQQDMIKSVDY